MGEPGLAQRLEAAPAVVRAQRHAKEIAHLAIEVGEVALRMGDRPDGEIGQPRQALGQQTQRHAFARARVAVDHREAALADQPVLDAPAEVLEARRHMDRLGGHLGREGVPLEPVEGEQFGVHARSCSAGGSGDRQIGRRQAGGGVVGEQLGEQRRHARRRQRRQIDRARCARPARPLGVGGLVERGDRAQHGAGVRIDEIDPGQVPARVAQVHHGQRVVARRDLEALPVQGHGAVGAPLARGTSMRNASASTVGAGQSRRTLGPAR
jgi:hypothetical protein